MTPGGTYLNWHERFMMQVPAQLTRVLMPWLDTLKHQVEAMGKTAGASGRHVLEACAYLANVVVQDALELVDAIPDHPVHKMLLQQKAFR